MAIAIESAGTAGFVHPTSVFTGFVASAGSRVTSGTIKNHQGSRLDVFFVTDIDNNDTLATGIVGIQAVAWQADSTDDDWVAVTIESEAHQAIGTLTFGTDGAASGNQGWVWIMRAI